MRMFGLLALTIGITAVVGCLAIIQPDWDEISDFLYSHISPRRFKHKIVRILTAPDQRQIILVGTLHGRHFTDSQYPIGELLSLVDYFKAQQVLVEIRPEDFQQERFHMGSNDMAFLALWAKREKLPAAGFDSWDPQTWAEALRNNNRDVINSPERNKAMARNLSEATQPGVPTIAFCGYSHGVPLENVLLEQGWKSKPPPVDFLDQLSAPPHIEWASLNPALSIQKSREQLRRWIDAESKPSPWSKELRKKDEQLQELGRQLVDPNQ